MKRRHRRRITESEQGCLFHRGKQGAFTRLRSAQGARFAIFHQGEQPAVDVGPLRDTDDEQEHSTAGGSQSCLRFFWGAIESGGQPVVGFVALRQSKPAQSGRLGGGQGCALHPPTRAALRGATARSASSSTFPLCPPLSMHPFFCLRLHRPAGTLLLGHAEILRSKHQPHRSCHSRDAGRPLFPRRHRGLLLECLGGCRIDWFRRVHALRGVSRLVRDARVRGEDEVLSAPSR